MPKVLIPSDPVLKELNHTNEKNMKILSSMLNDIILEIRNLRVNKEKFNPEPMPSEIEWYPVILAASPSKSNNTDDNSVFKIRTDDLIYKGGCEDGYDSYILTTPSLVFQSISQNKAREIEMEKYRSQS